MILNGPMRLLRPPIGDPAKKISMKKMIAAITALLIGGMLYVLLRSDSLSMFKWFAAIGVKEEVRALRLIARPHLSNLPQWVYLSLPQALWYFSGLLAFQGIWGGSPSTRRERRAWMLIFSVLAFFFEAGQIIHVVPGNFDLLDLALLLAAWGIVAAIGSVEQHWAVDSQLGGA